MNQRCPRPELIVYRKGNPNVFSLTLNDGNGPIVPGPTLTINLEIRESAGSPVTRSIPLQRVPGDGDVLTATLPDLWATSGYVFGVLISPFGEPSYRVMVCEVNIVPAGYLGDVSRDASGLNVIIDQSYKIINVRFDSPGGAIAAAYAAQVRAESMTIQQINNHLLGLAQTTHSDAQLAETARQQVVATAQTVGQLANQVTNRSQTVATQAAQVGANTQDVLAAKNEVLTALASAALLVAPPIVAASASYATQVGKTNMAITDTVVDGLLITDELFFEL